MDSSCGCKHDRIPLLCILVALIYLQRRELIQYATIKIQRWINHYYKQNNLFFLLASKPYSSMVESKPSYIYPAKESDDGDNDVFEFDEADIWIYNSSESTTNAQDGKKPLPSSRASSAKKIPRKMEFISVNHNTQKMASASLPVNVPDWSKILKAEYRVRGDKDGDGDDGDGDDRDGWVPPHEYLARRRGASFSVHEGIGRTLKGRDLRCVRNAVWKETGFED
ncbi:hypothetical protein HRI_001670500 [Hibiscus trionum]|uniref:Senescence regulator S40 n=1 Tax=Hibiscus trionum TaxID=183268 RepID=A0A9W7LW67_HIBTR|nr:hypothetical protein HRI_001670500 [Hibiscus trionum]